MSSRCASDPEPEVTDGIPGQDRIKKKRMMSSRTGASDGQNPKVTDGGQAKKETDDEQPGASDPEPEVTDGGQDKEDK